ncbi:MAG TPA: CoA pyrophosphatase [Actinomycetota bacterium]|nr:CoA pyrophosphatase [Actinomycetota bacterium]
MDDDFKARLRDLLQGRTPQKISVDDARDAAVLIPIVGAPEPTLIFTVRTDTVRSHKGQISFPGGSIDPADDGSPVAAAVREANEEVGLDPSAVEIVGELDSFPTFVTGFVVTPVVGWIEDAPDLRPNPHEVADVLLVPLADLSEEIRSEPGFTHAARTYPTEAWVWNDHVIWGVTARIIRSFLSALADAGLCPAPGETSSWTGWPLPAAGQRS